MDTRFWEKKWEDTYGYLLFKNTFSALDVLNARFRYDRRDDRNFPISFDKTTYSIINNTIKNRMYKKLFWAAVVAPTQAFFDGNWKQYHPRGDEFREIQLCNLADRVEVFAKMSPEKRKEAIDYISKELKDLGMKSSPDKKVPKRIPATINKPQKAISYQPPLSQQEALDALYEGLVINE